MNEAGGAGLLEDIMLSLTLQTDRDPDDVARRLEAYFGTGGIGLDAEKDEDCYTFVGGGGHVSARVSRDGGGTCVDLETQEFEREVRQFAREGL